MYKPSVFDLLKDIEKRPEIYLGYSPSERRKQLQGLEILLMGYGHAVERHGLDDPGKEFLRLFGQYLRTTRRMSVGAGVVAAIREVAVDDDAAWETFWRLVREFEASRSPGQPRG